MSTITTRAGKGSPLTNNEVDANFTNLNTDKAELSGATFTGEITANGGIALGDSDKATFGAGDDLQIYHDGSHSYIQDSGSGNLRILVGDLQIRNYGSNENVITSTANAEVALYHNASQKLATTSTGIDINGQATMDGLTVVGSGSKIRYDVASSNPHTNPTLHLENQNTTDGNVASLMLSADNANSAGGSAYIYAQSETANQKGNLVFAREDGANNPVTSMKLSSNGDISFYEDTGTTAKFFWDASTEKLTVGGALQFFNNGSSSIVDGGDDLRLRATNAVKIQNFNSTETMAEFVPSGAVTLNHANSPKLTSTSTGIDVTGTATANNLTLSNAAGVTSISVNAPQYSSSWTLYSGAAGANAIGFYDGSAYRLTVNSTGIDVTGTATMDGLVVQQPSGANILLESTTAGATTGDIFGEIEFKTNDSSSAGVKGKIDSYSEGGVGNGALRLFTGNTTGLYERLRIDSSGNVGINTSSPVSELDIAGTTPTLTIKDTQDKNWTSSDTTLGELAFRTSDASGIGAHNVAFVRAVNEVASSSTPSGALSFGISSSNANASEAMRISSAGNLALMTDGAEFQLYYTQPRKFISNSGASVTIKQIDNDSSNAFIDFAAWDNSSLMRLMNSGNVGIGVSTPYSRLQVLDEARVSSASNSAGKLALGDGGTGNDNIGIWRGSANSASDGNWLNLGAWGDSGITFSVGSAVFGSKTERMRIDSSGNLLVGKTANNLTSDGIVLRGSGELFVTRAGDVATFNRRGGTGDIVRFAANSTTVGAIRSDADSIGIGSGNVGLLFYNAGDRIIPRNEVGTSDGALDLGFSSDRFDDIYATNGTIQTSDRNEKQDIAELSDAEQRVAVAAKGLLRKFRWKNAVVEKGDDARVHFGIIAQDLQAAFEAEGLDAGDYAMFISTTWTDEETNEEKTRMGVRYSELLAFIIAAI